MKKYAINFGFTLAEVLITLGIIGVVAAITIPTLIQNHKRHVVETRLAKFYSVMNQAFEMAEAEHSDKKDWDIQNTDLSTLEWYNKYLSKYINTVKIETAENIANSSNTTLPLVLYFPDGSLVRFTKKGWLFFPEAKDYKYCFALERVQECSGKKYFDFFSNPSSDNVYMKNKGLEPYKYNWDGTIDGKRGLKTNNGLGCKKELPTNSRAYCGALIQQNGWKIPKDYPIRF